MGNSTGKALENPQGEEDDESSFTCKICIEPTSPSKKFKNANICRHAFCQDCIAKYIEVKVQDSTAKIDCPEPNCQFHLDPLICRPMISPDLFSSWSDLLCESSLLGSERSYCPNRNCMALVLNECRGNVKKSKCPNCKQLFCFQCQTVWHAGYQCEESEQMRDRNDVLFGQLVERKKWTRCPACGHCIERLLGCSLVKCRSKETVGILTSINGLIRNRGFFVVCLLGRVMMGRETKEEESNGINIVDDDGVQMQDRVLLPVREKVNEQGMWMQAQFGKYDDGCQPVSSPVYSCGLPFRYCLA
ncbi:probable E3 ubiquitin-protein ligase RNF217 isoform X1 [Herrania umbratica]|uniref:RBR-type E3 ubiquitin transferase n=1 Tax=Herrania umbratica TaxID=108875 RepID=A0A6J1AVU1_9ROSI|nr:probable E3 ubiquitin-protein ligase RNF217 isoform X1 [Herrania umbratica]